MKKTRKNLDLLLCESIFHRKRRPIFKDLVKPAILIFLMVFSLLRIGEHTLLANSTHPFKESLFEYDSTVYNDDLAKLSAEICNRAQGSSSKNIESYYKELGCTNIKAGNYSSSQLSGAAYSFAEKTFSLNNSISYSSMKVIVINARGSNSLAEFVGDWAKGFINNKTKDFFGRTVFTNVHEFEEKVWYPFKDYVSNLKIGKNEKVVVLVTGHSLGGAAANMLAARLNDKHEAERIGLKNLTKEKVYCYTFGAIKVFDHNDNEEYGYENILNIYNYYDSFGPNGNKRVFSASDPLAKFGKTVSYELEDVERNDGINIFWTNNNHDISNYQRALEQGLVLEGMSFMGIETNFSMAENRRREREEWKENDEENRGKVEGKNLETDFKPSLNRGYLYCEPFSEGLAKVTRLVKDENGFETRKSGFINQKGEEVIECKWTITYNVPFYGGTAVVHNGYEAQIIDRTGKPIIDKTYNNAFSYGDGLVRVYKDKLVGVVNREGKELLPPVYDYRDLSELEGGFTAYRTGGKWNIKNFHGKDIVKNLDSDSDFQKASEGLVAVRKKKKWGFINEKGKVVIPFKYLSVGRFHEGLARVQDKKGTWSYIDKNGKKKIKLNKKYSLVCDFHEGLAKVKIREFEYAFINKKGKEVIKLTSPYVSHFSDGYAAVGKLDSGRIKIGYIDKKGKLKIKHQFELPYSSEENDYWKSYEKRGYFIDGTAVILKHGKYGTINKKGKVLVDFQYNFSNYGEAFFREGIRVIKENDKFGCMDSEGKIVIPCEYDWILGGFGDNISARKGGKWYYFNKKGEKFLELPAASEEYY